MAEEYVTIQGEARDEFIERKSRFIGFIRHVETEAEALSFIQEIRQSIGTRPTMCTPICSGISLCSVTPMTASLREPPGSRC